MFSDELSKTIYFPSEIHSQLDMKGVEARDKAFSHKSMALGELSGRFPKSNFLNKVRKLGLIFLGKCGNDDVIRIKSYDSGLKEIAFQYRKLLRVFHH